MTPARMRGAALATIVLIAGAGVAQTETAREDPALARAWFEVPVPGGVAALAQAAGLDPATERWRLLPDLTRRLHAPFGDRTGPRVVAQLTALLAPADRRHQAGGAALLVAAGGRVPALSPLATTASPRPALPGTDDGDGGGLLLAPAPAAAAVAAPTTSAGEERLPVPLTPEAWRRILGHDRATRAPRDLLATVVIDPRAARLLRGLLALDLTTLATLSGEPDTLREIARRQPDAFATFSASFRVQDGRVFVPGGHPEAARWQELVGASVMKPAEFLRRLAFADEGRLFYFYDSLDRLDDAHRRFALSAAEPAPRSAERTRALRAVFAAAEPWWLETRPPLSRPVADAARVLQVARVTP